MTSSAHAASARATTPHPARVSLLIGLGNASTSELLRMLDDAWLTVSSEFASPHAGVVTLERQRIVVLHRA